MLNRSAILVHILLSSLLAMAMLMMRTTDKCHGRVRAKRKCYACFNIQLFQFHQQNPLCCNLQSANNILENMNASNYLKQSLGLAVFALIQTRCNNTIRFTF